MEFGEPGAPFSHPQLGPPRQVSTAVNTHESPGSLLKDVLSISSPDPLSADGAWVRHQPWRRGGTRSWGQGELSSPHPQEYPPLPVRHSCESRMSAHAGGGAWREGWTVTRCSSAACKVTFLLVSMDVIVGDHGRRQPVACGLPVDFSALGCGVYRDLRGRPRDHAPWQAQGRTRRADGSALLQALAQTTEPLIVAGPAGPRKGIGALAPACVAPPRAA